MTPTQLEALTSQTLIVKNQYTELKARANAVGGNLVDMDKRLDTACNQAMRERDGDALNTLLELRAWIGEALKALARFSGRRIM